MGWFILILVLIAIAFGILGAVVKAVAFIVLTIVFTLIALGAITYFVVKHQARRFRNDPSGRRQLPS
jgi:peptidoglycan/LPS O-acetylase OafA/YrhL